MRKPNEGALGGEYVVHQRAAAEMLPYFAATQLPWGIAGVVLLALVAGSLATLDSGLSAIGATVVFDLFRRFGLGRRWLAKRLGKAAGDLDSADELQLARPLTLVLGAAVSGAALLVALLAQHLAILDALAGALAAPLLGVLLLGMLTRRATAAAAALAVVAGLVFSICLIPQGQRLADSWVIVFGTLATFGLGYVLSFLFGRRKSHLDLRGLVAGCGTLGIRGRDEPAPRITLPAITLPEHLSPERPAPDEAEGSSRWK
jgi:Na+/proline symporter